MKVLPPAPCEVRERILEAYRKAEPFSAKQTSIFAQLFAHEEKHGCGKKFARKEDIPNFGATEIDMDEAIE
jgi:hypothetical protein